jgi:hypothetical protein
MQCFLTSRANSHVNGRQKGNPTPAKTALALLHITSRFRFNSTRLSSLVPRLANTVACPSSSFLLIAGGPSSRQHYGPTLFSFSSYWRWTFIELTAYTSLYLSPLRPPTQSLFLCLSPVIVRPIDRTGPDLVVIRITSLLACPIGRLLRVADSIPRHTSLSTPFIRLTSTTAPPQSTFFTSNRLLSVLY